MWPSFGKCEDQASDWNSCLMFVVMGNFIKLRGDVGVNGEFFFYYDIIVCNIYDLKVI